MIKKNYFAVVAMVLGLLVFGSTNSLGQATGNATWINWTAPASYPSSATWMPSDRPAVTYSYTSSLSGTLAFPGGGGSVNVSQTGEVTNESCFAATAAGCENYWGTTIGGWAGGPGPAAYLSGSVPNLPDSPTLIALTGMSSQNQSFTFSAPVRNIVMNVFSLGSTGVFGGVGVTVAYTFNQDFEIVSQASDCDFNIRPDFCIWKVGNTLYGREGSGTIRFTGEFTLLTFSASDVEHYNGFQLGMADIPYACDLDGALTRSQGGWHNTSRSNPLDNSWFGAKFPSGLRVGLPGRSITLTNPDSVRIFLPSGSTARALDFGDASDYLIRREYKNVLAGQAVAATLNLALSPSLSTAVIASGMGIPYEGHSISNILSLANDALGGGFVGSSSVYSNLNHALDVFNNSFLGGNSNGDVVCVEEDEPAARAPISTPESPMFQKSPLFKKRQ
jgi:hypothetical protein